MTLSYEVLGFYAALIVWAALLGVAAQLVMHVVYGREYVLYAPHWHAVRNPERSAVPSGSHQRADRWTE